MVKVVRLKDVGVKGAFAEDWDVLTEFATTYQLSMPEVLHICATAIQGRLQHDVVVRAIQEGNREFGQARRDRLDKITGALFPKAESTQRKTSQSR